MAIIVALDHRRAAQGCCESALTKTNPSVLLAFAAKSAEMHRMIIRLVLVSVMAATSFAYAAADPAKDDFRGLKTGMSRDEAHKAASAHGGQCADIGQSAAPAQGVCAFGNEAKAVLYYTPKGHLTRIRVVFSGDFDELEMQKYLIQAYGLSPDQLSLGFYGNGSQDRFNFSRLGGDKYVLEIINHSVAMKDDPEPKSRLPQL